MVESGKLRILVHTLSYRVAALPPWGHCSAVHCCSLQSWITRFDVKLVVSQNYTRTHGAKSKQSFGAKQTWKSVLPQPLTRRASPVKARPAGWRKVRQPSVCPGVESTDTEELPNTTCTGAGAGSGSAGIGKVPVQVLLQVQVAGAGAPYPRPQLAHQPEPR